MGTIAKVTAGGATHLVASTCYGTCATAAATAAKVATIQDSQAFTLMTGVTVHIKFTYANGVANPTLNVNSTGAKKIYRYGTTAPSTSAATSWQAGSVVSFTYDGTYWQMNGWLNDNTTYSAVSKTAAGLCPALPNETTTTKYLRQDGTWVVPPNTTYTAASAAPGKVASASAVGTSANYARQDHTHGIDLATGDANGQVKIAGTNVAVKGLGSAAYTESTAYATASHTHSYAGSSSAGGAATSANKLNTDAGSMLNPVYFSDGVPVASKGNSIPFVVGTGTTAGTWLGTLDGLTAYYDGLLILYKSPVAGASTTTLNLNSLGAKNVYINNTTKLTTHFPANQPILLVYSTSQNSGCWMCLDDYWTDSNTVPQAHCTTAAATAAKAASMTYYVATAKSYVMVNVRYANTAASAITLNINSTGAKPIYINGSASSASNYTLPAGSYLVYYDGTNYYFRTDGKITGTTTGNGTSNLTIGTTATTAAAGNHTHATSIATSTGTNQLTLAASTKYVITAGGTSYVFTTPPNTTYSSQAAASGGTTTSLCTTGEKYTWNNKAAKSSALNLTAAAASWSASGTITLTATGVTASNNIVVGAGSGCTADQYAALAKAQILCTAQAANSITLTAFGTVPTIDVPISVVILG